MSFWQRLFGGQDSTVPQQEQHGGQHQDPNDEAGPVVHMGVKCDGCGEDPISGDRYKCALCSNYDLCSACLDRVPPVHPEGHPLIKIKTSIGNAAAAAAPAPAASAATASSSDSSPAAVVFSGDVNMPDGSVVSPDATLVKSWRLKVETDLPLGTKLIFLSGHRQLVDEIEFPVASSVKPGDSVEVSAVLQTPKNPGRYQAFFRLADANSVPFGPQFHCDLVVS